MYLHHRSNYSQIRLCLLQTNHYSQSQESVDKGDFLIRRFRPYSGNLRTTGQSLFAVSTICEQKPFSYSQIHTVNRKSANYGEPLFAVYTICGQRRFSYSQIQTVNIYNFSKHNIFREFLSEIVRS